MSVRSAAGFVEISVRVDSGGDPWIGSNTKGEGCFSDEAVETLITELAAAIGKDVTLSEPKVALPTEPGIYVSGDMAKSDHLQSAQIYKLKESGWTNADGASVDIWRVEQIANVAGGLVRLTPEGE